MITPASRRDTDLEHVHWATNRRQDWPSLRIFAFDHRAQLAAMAKNVSAPATRLEQFKKLCLKAALAVADGQTGYGILCDGRFGRQALYDAAGTGLWIGRPVEIPGSRPLVLELDLDYSSALADWPIDHVVKVLCSCHPDDDELIWAKQEAVLLKLAKASRSNKLELLIELVPSGVGKVNDDTNAKIMQHLYQLGLKPDWWKLEPTRSASAWSAVADIIDEWDTLCRGVLLLGKGAPLTELQGTFEAAAKHPCIKGFAVGRSVFADAARAWLADDIDDDQAVADMAENYRSLCIAWDRAHAKSD